MNTEVWLEFARQNWLILLIALVAILLVVNVVKTMIKWAIAVVIVVALIVYSGVSLDKIQSTVSDVKNEAVSKLQQEALKMLKDEADQAKFKQNADNSFTVETASLKLVGQPNASTVEVTYRGVPLGEWKRSEQVNALIRAAKSRR
ncbi:ATPase [Saccharibacillus sp. CPCC 101409]|uniref:ATPase n=1 Tax=Saccharibacillus sp. CPCC 101409 TaxID=3058041 RepID=UPI002673C653|nr:ATPase [Saccharibacillus sp. CPCC 101409]MDO3410997.1 ATPase [Saccharibacillus sp. CPCC 101409]